MDDNTLVSSDIPQNQLNYFSKVTTLHKLTNQSKYNYLNGVKDSNLRSQAFKLAQQGEYEQAIALLDLLIDRHPDSAVDYNNRGLVYFQSGELQKALDDYNLAIDLNPSLASAYNNRANYYATCGDLTAAITDYDRALDYNPQHVRAWINRAITLRDLGRYAEAIENFEIALLFDQFQSQIWAQRGRTYHLWGDWNCAIADYHRVLAQLPINSDSQDLSNYCLRLQVEIWLDELLSHA